MVPPRSDRISRVPSYSRTNLLSTRTGLSPTLARLSRRFRFLQVRHWPGPRSLATTNGVSVDVLSSGYLDVSVHRVCLAWLCIHHTIPLKRGGFPHSEIHGSESARNSPWLIAACYVLHRLSVPRHPPDALRRLFFEAATRRVKPRARELAKTQHTQPQTGLSVGRGCRLGQNFFTMSKSVKLLTISYQLSTDNPGHQPGQTLLPFPSAPASPRLSTLRLQPFAPG